MQRWKVMSSSRRAVQHLDSVLGTGQSSTLKFSWMVGGLICLSSLEHMLFKGVHRLVLSTGRRDGVGPGFGVGIEENSGGSN